MALGSRPGIDASPRFAIEINGTGIDDNLGRLITMLEYDSTDGGADQMKLTFSNPNLILCDKTILQIGNTIRLWGGFGETEHYIGGGLIEKSRPTFPAGDTMPSIEVVAHTADVLMMRNSPPPEDDTVPFASEGKKGKSKNVRTWPPGAQYSDVIRDKALAYGFTPDVDDTPDWIIGPDGVIQKTDIDDFQFVMNVANELGWLFWVECNETFGWTLHFKDPDKASEIQDFEFEFIYNRGDAGTLLSFDGEQLIGDAATQVDVQLWNPRSGQLETYSVTVDPLSAPTEYVGIPDEPILLPPGDGAEITLSFGGVALKVISDRLFQTPGEAKQWVENWARQHNQHLFVGNGEVRGPGAEKLTARQVHKISGLTSNWNGHYYFTHVTHKWTDSTGYSVHWDGRKVPTRGSVEYTSQFEAVPDLVLNT